MSAATMAPAGTATGRDDRKTAHLIDRFLKPFPGSRVSRSFVFSREILRSSDMRQAGSSADTINLDSPEHVSFFFLDGEAHRKRRASVAGYFTPKAILTRYNPLMERVMAEEIATFRAKGRARLDDMSFVLAAAVTVEILGLTNSDVRVVGPALKTLMDSGNSFDKRPVRRFVNDRLLGWYHRALRAYRVAKLWKHHFTPAIEARRAQPRDDVISYMIKENYSPRAMLVEVLTYSGAGVSTTREFMVMAAWQLSDHPELKAQFLAADREGQFAIIEEILRLDPVAGYLYRRTATPVAQTAEGPLDAGELLAINIRAGNSDPAVVGDEPHRLDPERARRQKIIGSYLSFGDGPHRCPGSQVALHETRIFLDHVLRVPGFRFEKAPRVGWSLATQGYELRDAIVACDRA